MILQSCEKLLLLLLLISNYTNIHSDHNATALNKPNNIFTLFYCLFFKTNPLNSKEHFDI